MNAGPFDTIQHILRCLSLVQSLFKDQNTQIWRIGNRLVNASTYLRAGFGCIGFTALKQEVAIFRIWFLIFSLEHDHFASNEGSIDNFRGTSGFMGFSVIKPEVGVFLFESVFFSIQLFTVPNFSLNRYSPAPSFYVVTPKFQFFCRKYASRLGS